MEITIKRETDGKKIDVKDIDDDAAREDSHVKEEGKGGENEEKAEVHSTQENDEEKKEIEEDQQADNDSTGKFNEPVISDAQISKY